MTHHRNRWENVRPGHSKCREERWELRNFLGTILSAMLFTILLAVGAGECGRSLVDVGELEREARGEHLLRDMFDAVTAYPYDKLAELAGPRPTGARGGDFSFDLGMTDMGRDTMRIEATLRDSATREQIGRFVTYRSRT